EVNKTLQLISNENPGLEELTVVPLYPHYAMSSYETAVEHLMQAYRKGNYAFKVSMTPVFYNDANYINALAESFAPHLQQEYDHVLFSYHGIPERHVMKADPTGQHCLKCENCCDISNEAHAWCYRHQ